jgi:hypothetical protein
MCGLDSASISVAAPLLPAAVPIPVVVPARDAATQRGPKPPYSLPVDDNWTRELDERHEVFGDREAGLLGATLNTLDRYTLQ